MLELRPVCENFAVAPQLTPEDLGAVAAAGYRLVLNNRPDGEVHGQPTGEQIAAACAAAGLAYKELPFAGPPPRAAVEGVAALISAQSGPILAFCRTGTRSITAWAMAEALAGRRKADDIIALAARAGYDLGGARGALVGLEGG